MRPSSPISHVLMETRNGLIVDTCVTKATEREAALSTASAIPNIYGVTLGADKDVTARFSTGC